MTVLCGGGTSSPQPGAPSNIVSTSSSIANLLANTGNGWAIGIAAGLDVLQFVVSSLCATDPPAIPSFNITDYVALLSPSPSAARTTAAGKLADLLTVLYWHNLCQCDVGAQPAAPAPTTPPSGAVQAPIASGSTLSPCASIRHRENPLVGPEATGQTIWANEPADPPITRVAITWSVVPSGAGPHPPVSFSLEWDDASGFGFPVHTEATVVVASGASSAQYVYERPSTAAYLSATCTSANSSDYVAYSFDFYSGNCRPGGLTDPLGGCAPDPAVLARLDQLMTLVTLIQRQIVPFGYIPGTVHAGLSGAGAFSISGILGCKVAVTTLPGAYGRGGSSPADYFGLGYVTFGTPDGYPTSHRLEHNPQLILPVRCSAYTDLAYDLAPGVAVTITELVREP